MMYFYNDFPTYHMFGLGPIFMLIFWGVIIYGVVMFVRQKNNPIDILKGRYAKGEITKDQFEAMKKDLQ